MIEVLTNLKLIFFIVFFIVFMILENYFSQRNTKGKMKRLFFHVTIAVINTVIMRVFVIFLLIPVMMITNENQYGLLNTIEYNFFLEALFGFLLLDLAFYWFHRISHTWDFLWRFHGMHHLDTQMDVTTSLRFHIGELLISAFFKAVLIITLGLPISVFIFYEIILTASAQFHHSDLRLPESLDSKISKSLLHLNIIRIITPSLSSLEMLIMPLSLLYGIIFSLHIRMQLLLKESILALKIEVKNLD